MLLGGAAQAKPIEVASPDGRLRLTVEVTDRIDYTLRDGDDAVLGGEGTVSSTTQTPEKTDVYTPTADPDAAVSVPETPADSVIVEEPAESVIVEEPAESVPEETVPADQPADAEQPADTQTPEPEAPAEGETGGDTPAEAPSISLPTQEEVEQAASSIYNAASSIWGAIQDAASQQNDAA